MTKDVVATYHGIANQYGYQSGQTYRLAVATCKHWRQFKRIEYPVIVRSEDNSAFGRGYWSFENWDEFNNNWTVNECTCTTTTLS